MKPLKKIYHMRFIVNPFLNVNKIYILIILSTGSCFGFGQSNIAKSKIVSASATYQSGNANAIVDENLTTAWNSGSYAPQWVSINLQGQYDISKIKLIPTISPSGNTTQEILTSSDLLSWKFVDVFTTYTTEKNPIERSFPTVLKNIRGIKILTTKSPSWIAWYEIEVYGIDTNEKHDENAVIEEKYEGELKDGKRNGQGTYTWASGDQYNGEWKNGEMNGQGTFIFSNRDKYKGTFQNNKKNGFGTYTWASGEVYSGYFENNNKTNGAYYNSNGINVAIWENGIEKQVTTNSSSSPTTTTGEALLVGATIVKGLVNLFSSSSSSSASSGSYSSDSSSKSSSSECYFCKGKGKCYSCKGKGEFICSYCDGTGIERKLFCDPKVCSNCDGKGYNICSTCEGKGTCTWCNGTGKKRH